MEIKKIRPGEWAQTFKEKAAKVDWNKTKKRAALTVGVGAALVSNGFLVGKLSTQDAEIAKLKESNRIVISELSATQELQGVELRHFCEDEKTIGNMNPMQNCDAFVEQILQLREQQAQGIYGSMEDGN